MRFFSAVKIFFPLAVLLAVQCPEIEASTVTDILKTIAEKLDRIENLLKDESTLKDAPEEQPESSPNPVSPDVEQESGNEPESAAQTDELSEEPEVPNPKASRRGSSRNRNTNVNNNINSNTRNKNNLMTRRMAPNRPKLRMLIDNESNIFDPPGKQEISGDDE